MEAYTITLTASDTSRCRLVVPQWGRVVVPLWREREREKGGGEKRGREEEMSLGKENKMGEKEGKT